MACKKKRRRGHVVVKTGRHVDPYATTALAGHARTCVQFQCVKGRGKDFEGEGICKKGYVLRCAEFVDLPGLPRTAGTRKPYQEFTYGQGPRYRGARSRFAPKLPAEYLAPVDKWVRGLPGSAVRPGKGVRRKG